jgi:hypothetical protein
LTKHSIHTFLSSQITQVCCAGKKERKKKKKRRNLLGAISEPRMMPRKLANLCLSLLFSHVALAAYDAPCYNPAGQLAIGYYPCDPTAYITNCCPQGYTCYSNSLCVVTNGSPSFPNLTVGTAVRGACTNPKWANAICGDYCLLGKLD